MMPFSNSYGRLLRAQAKRDDYVLEYSDPQLVNGGLAPPPNPNYPGTVCYMVIVTINNSDFFGFGPTASIAKHFAEFEAYNSINPLPNKLADKVRHSIPLEDIEEGDVETSPYKTDFDNFESQSLYDYSNDISERLAQSPNGVLARAATAKSDCNNSQDRSHSTERVLTNEASPDSAPITSNGNSADEYCDIPYSPHFKMPQTMEEHIAMVEAPPPLPRSTGPDTREYHHTAHMGPKDIVSKLYDVAKGKGLYVTFDFKMASKQLVVARASAGGFSFEARSSRKYIAKCEAASKLLQTIIQLPDRFIQQTTNTFSTKLSPPPPYQARPDLHHASRSEVQDQHRDIKDTLPVESKESGDVSIDEQQNQTSSSSQSPTDSKASSSSDRPGSSLITSNPIGQLQELLTREHLDLPMYAHSSSSIGKFTDFTCVASAKGLSAKGVGSTKKLAKRHAAENLLGHMLRQGMTIDPVTRSPRAKMSEKPKVDITRNVEPPHRVQSHDVQATPTHHRPPSSCPPDQFRPITRQIPMPHRPLQTAFPVPTPRFHTPLPFGPRPSYPRHPISPPNFQRFPPPPQPHTRKAHAVSSESESDTECERRSSGLREVIPPATSTHAPPTARRVPFNKLQQLPSNFQHNMYMNNREPTPFKNLEQNSRDMSRRVKPSALKSPNHITKPMPARSQCEASLYVPQGVPLPAGGNRSFSQVQSILPPFEPRFKAPPNVPQQSRGVISRPTQQQGQIAQGQSAGVKPSPKTPKSTFVHQQMPMPGVRVSSQSKPVGQCQGTSPVQRRTKSAPDIQPYSRPHPYSQLSRYKSNSNTHSSEEKMQAVKESSFMERSDPLQFVTRLPMKRKVPWSSPGKPLGPTKSPWSKMKQDELRSRRRPFAVSAKPFQKKKITSATAAKPWAPPVCEMWSSDNEENTVTENVASVVSDSDKIIVSLKTKDEGPLETESLLTNSEKVADEVNAGDDPIELGTEIVQTPNVQSGAHDGSICMSEDASPLNKSLKTPVCESDFLPPVTEVWKSQSDDELGKTNSNDKMKNEVQCDPWSTDSGEEEATKVNTYKQATPTPCSKLPRPPQATPCSKLPRHPQATPTPCSKLPRHPLLASAVPVDHSDTRILKPTLKDYVIKFDTRFSRQSTASTLANSLSKTSLEPRKPHTKHDVSLGSDQNNHIANHTSSIMTTNNKSTSKCPSKKKDTTVKRVSDSFSSSSLSGASCQDINKGEKSDESVSGKVFRFSSSVNCSLFEDCSVSLPTEGSLQALAGVLH